MGLFLQPVERHAPGYFFALFQNRSSYDSCRSTRLLPKAYDVKEAGCGSDALLATRRTWTGSTAEEPGAHGRHVLVEAGSNCRGITAERCGCRGESGGERAKQTPPARVLAFDL
jgi:hypothetical protein